LLGNTQCLTPSLACGSDPLDEGTTYWLSEDHGKLSLVVLAGD